MQFSADCCATQLEELENKYNDMIHQIATIPWDKNGTEIRKGDWVISPTGNTVQVVDLVGRIVYFLVGEISTCGWSTDCTLTSPPKEPPKYVDRYGIPVNVKDKVLFLNNLKLGPQRVVAMSVNLEEETVFQVEEHPIYPHDCKYKSHQIVKVYQ